ncbi:MAG: hypothetical protein C4567_13635 [Deltaproteobacteria bacterium]|nr:MAG: hypothetical protein C4567_13635 [Deltaproteobacteria bacterium]
MKNLSLGATRTSNLLVILLVIIGIAGKCLAAENEILQLLRSLRMTVEDIFAEVSTLNLEP